MDRELEELFGRLKRVETQFQLWEQAKLDELRRIIEQLQTFDYQVRKEFNLPRAGAPRARETDLSTNLFKWPKGLVLLANVWDIMALIDGPTSEPYITYPYYYESAVPIASGDETPDPLYTPSQFLLKMEHIPFISYSTYDGSMGPGGYPGSEGFTSISFKATPTLPIPAYFMPTEWVSQCPPSTWSAYGVYTDPAPYRCTFPIAQVPSDHYSYPDGAWSTGVRNAFPTYDCNLPYDFVGSRYGVTGTFVNDQPLNVELHTPGMMGISGWAKPAGLAWMAYINTNIVAPLK